MVLGLTFGIGLFLVWWSSWTPDVTVGPASPRRSRLMSRVEDDLLHAGYPTLTARSLLLAGVIAFTGVALIGYTLVGVLPIAMCFGLMAGYAPLALVRMRARARRRRLRDVWPDAVDNLASAVRAGMALPEALTQLAVRGPEELRAAFAAFAEDYRLTGRFPDSLDRLKDRLSDPVGDRLVESMRIAREVGGSDLGRLLRTLSTFLREDARTRAEMETRQSWTVSAARLAVAAPWAVLAMLSTRPESVQAYSTRVGVLVLAIGGGVTLLAYRVMLRIGRLPEDERVLR